jgi:RNA polymerase sigma factor (sigma-70 family)
MATQQATTILRAIRAVAGKNDDEQASDRDLLRRFAGERDEDAFGALVRRHAPMVLGVGLRVLRHYQDAEDICQAAFLLLARKAGTTTWRDSAAGWLYEAAYRLALKARGNAIRRTAREAKVGPKPPPDPLADVTLRDLQAVIDEELTRLPRAYRMPLVLCCLEGKTRDEAACCLGVPLAAVKCRLEEGRKLLRRRLARRGLPLSVALAGVTLLPRAAPAATPVALVSATSRAALRVLAGQATAGIVGADVADLINGGVPTMNLPRLKIATALLLAAGVLTTAIAALTQNVPARADPPGADSKDKPRADSKAAARPAGAPGEGPSGSVAYRGHVLGPDGRPVAGAKLYLTPTGSYLGRPYSSPEYATTGPDGRFQFTAPKSQFGDRFTVVTATLANHGPGWVEVLAGSKTDDLTLRLVVDDVPVTGQVVNLEAKPVAGATLRVLQISAAPDEDLGPWLDAVRGKKGRSFDLEKLYLKRHTNAVPLKVTTDAEGRFKLTGVGRNRLVIAQLDGPGIASQRLHILTRHGKAVEATEYEGRPEPEYNDPRRVTIYYGSDFRHVAAPTRPVIGVVRDEETKKPLAGVSIRSYKLANNLTHFGSGQEVVLTTTDAHGRYRLTGMPVGKGNKIKLVPPDDLPYLAVAADVPDGPGLDPVTVDFDLKRGVWIEGKITDKVTGQPVKAGVQYLPLYSNPNRRDYPGVYELVFRSAGTVKEDGSYRVVGLPGPGMLAVYNQKDHFLLVSQREDEYGGKGLSDDEFPDHLRGSNCGALTRVNPARAAESVRRDVTLDPGWGLKGTVLGPDGKPLAGTRNILLVSHWWDHEATKTAEFAGWFNPHARYDMVFHHPEKGLVGVAQPPKENGGSITVRMEPGAAVTGRLVDTFGRPRAGVELGVSFRAKGWGSWVEYPPTPVTTDRDGRFRIEALPPGQEFRLSDGKGELPFGGGLRPGETKDLGDVTTKPFAKE